MTVNGYLVSLLRTGVPAAVGTLLAWLALHGLDVPAGARVQVLAVAGVVATTAYYAAVRALEKRWPKLGVLLGYPLAPAYSAAPAKPPVSPAPPPPSS